MLYRIVVGGVYYDVYKTKKDLLTAVSQLIMAGNYNIQIIGEH
jgi:hypothetical protein